MPVKTVRVVPFVSVRVTITLRIPLPFAIRVLPSMVTPAAVGATGAAVKKPPLTANDEFVPVVPAADCPIVTVIEKIFPSVSLLVSPPDAMTDCSIL